MKCVLFVSSKYTKCIWSAQWRTYMAYHSRFLFLFVLPFDSCLPFYPRFMFSNLAKYVRQFFFANLENRRGFSKFEKKKSIEKTTCKVFQIWKIIRIIFRGNWTVAVVPPESPMGEGYRVFLNYVLFSYPPTHRWEKNNWIFRNLEIPVWFLSIYVYIKYGHIWTIFPY